MSNTLSNKYLSRATPAPRPRHTGTEQVTVEDLGYLRPDFVAVGVYFCSAAGPTGAFGEFEHGLVDPLVDPIGRTWRLVSTEFVKWMAGMITKALESDSVGHNDLGVAILKFYRVRDRLEQEIAAADGLPAGDQHSPGGPGVGAAGEGRGEAAPEGAVTARQETEVAA